MQIKDRIFGANIDKKVIEKIKALGGGGLSGNEGDELSERKPTFEKYLGEKTPFARMWTAVNTFQTGSNIERGEEKSKNLVYIINSNRENSYDQNPNEEVKIGTNYRSQLENNPYLKPPAGITSVMSKTEGSLGVIKKTSVEFIVHNKVDFDTIFLPFFLRPGARVCVDFGWSDEKTDILYDPVERVTNSDLKMQDFDRFIYGGKEQDGKEVIGFVNNPKNKGLVNVVMGDVVNYDAKLTEQGSFQCTLEIVSRNTVLLDKSIDEENGLKFLFTNFIEDYLLQMFIYRVKADNTLVNDKLIPDKIDPFKTIIAEEARKKVFDELTKPSKKTGIINTPFLELGFFYQDITDGKKSSDSDREMVYINYGLFEDFFLNNIVVNFKDADNSDDAGKNVKSQVIYSSKGSFVRYANELVQLQKLPLDPEDSLPTFLYSENWEKSYNEKTRPESEKIKYDGSDGIIPIRELFISVPLIQESFASSNNVNDALVSIFASINEDSFDILNIQMTSNNDSDTSVGFQDINLLPELKPDEELIFDITGPTSIVKSADLSFKTPKSGLSSMIAIQNLSQPTLYTNSDLANLNLLNVLKADKNKNEKTVIRSLPISSNDTKNIEVSAILGSVDVADFIQSKTTGQITADDYSDQVVERTVRSNQDLVGAEALTRAATNIQSYYKAVEAAQVGQGGEKENKDANKQQTLQKKGEIDPVNTKREQHGTRARLNYVLKSGGSTIAPILPAELSLSVYGNNYLSVGDYFNVNFLPSHYKERVFFQVIGIEHKIGTSDWETSYTTVMRIRPDKKKVQFNPENETDSAKKLDQEIVGSKEMTKKDLSNKTSIRINDANIDTVVKHIPHGTQDDLEDFYFAEFQISVKDTIGARKITRYPLYNPHSFQFDVVKVSGGDGYGDMENLSKVYALTSMLADTKKPDFAIDLDKFTEFELDDDRVISMGAKTNIPQNSLRGNDGKSQITYRTGAKIELQFDSDFDDNFFFTNSDKENTALKFAEDLKKDYTVFNNKGRGTKGDDYLPTIENILYNLNSQDKYYTIDLVDSHNKTGVLDTIVLVPRLMKKSEFGLADAILFAKEFQKRHRGFLVKINEILEAM